MQGALGESHLTAAGGKFLTTVATISKIVNSVTCK